MQFLYNIFIWFTSFFLRAISLFNPKIKAGVQGRQRTFKVLKNELSEHDKTLWFHCASLGEYEQGLPVFQEVKKLYPKHKVVLTFFSPSGYEIRKNSAIANAVVYLPLDTKKNAQQFLDLVNPDLTIFVKYDIWPNLLSELKKRDKSAILISALFRKNQIYFRPFGRFMRDALRTFDHIFVQNQSSKTLLIANSIEHVSVSGDTRFDRVSKQLTLDNTIEIIQKFKQDKLCLVAGSTWPEDEKLLVEYINHSTTHLKFVIAPHTIKPNQIERLRASITKKTILFTEVNSVVHEEAEVLILNTIGLLSKAYAYADIAYVGGAMGTTGLHNTLEPAVFGIPILIGPNHSKFPEASAMIKNGGMFSAKNQNEFNSAIDKLLNENTRLEAGKKNSDYVKKNTGAVIQIMAFLRKYAV